jgi:V-type H+-transporting ATPase subunit G
LRFPRWTCAVRLITNTTTDRTKRIRDAKAEAQKEIEEYRNQKEEEYKKFEAEVRCPAGRQN